jgi:hypothetical protein
MALKSVSSDLFIRATLDATNQSVAQYFVEPGAITSRGYANTPLSDGRQLSILVNGQESAVQSLVENLKGAATQIDRADPFNWLIKTLGSDWIVVGDTRVSSDLFATESVATYQSASQTVTIVTYAPRRPIKDISEVGLTYESLDVVNVDGVEFLYQRPGPGLEGGPFAIALDKSGLLAEIDANTDAPGFAKLLSSLTVVATADLAKLAHA